MGFDEQLVGVVLDPQFRKSTVILFLELGDSSMLNQLHVVKIVLYYHWFDDFGRSEVLGRLYWGVAQVVRG